MKDADDSETGQDENEDLCGEITIGGGGDWQGECWV